jgi:hypothetical protein
MWPSWKRRWRAAGLVALGLSVACDWDWNREQREPPRTEPGPTPLANAPAPATNTPPLAGPASATDNARPSTDENMGRSFQGALELQLRTAAGEERGLRYLSRGNDARLQVDGVKGRGAFDALIWDENISIIDNGRRTYKTFRLDDVETSARPRQVKVDKTGERRSLQGVECERYEIDDGPLHVSAWVTGLSGTFAIDKFEKVSGLDVPAWAEELIANEQLPLQASVREHGGRELYTLTLTRYTAGSVDESMVTLPREYRRDPGQPIR